MSVRTLTSKSQYRPWEKDDAMKKLHQEFKSVNTGSSNPSNFKAKAEQLGFEPTAKLMKSLNDPQPQFRNVVKNLGKFHKPTNQEVINAKFIGNYNRYQKRGPAQGGNCKNTKLRALQDFQRGVINRRELDTRLGDSIKEVNGPLKRFNDGDFTKVGRKLIRSEQTRADQLEGPQNLDPILNKPNLLQRTKFENIKPITTKKLHQLALAESKDKTAWLVYNEKKGQGQQATFKGNNGDIVTWNGNGNIMTVEDHVTKVNRTRRPQAQRMFDSNLGAGVNARGGKNVRTRRDFAGSGNIIGWC